MDNQPPPLPPRPGQIPIQNGGGIFDNGFGGAAGMGGAFGGFNQPYGMNSFGGGGYGGM